MKDKKHKSKAEEKFLALGYARFSSLYNEIADKTFWEQDPYVRFSKIKDIISVYTELIKYEPIELSIENSTKPLAVLLAKDFIKFLRNVLQHFPFFNEWNEVYIDKELVTAVDNPGSINKFLSEEKDYGTGFVFEYPKQKHKVIANINLNTGYLEGQQVYLSEMIEEETGVILVCMIMGTFLDNLE